jgi:hypothetical protein
MFHHIHWENRGFRYFLHWSSRSELAIEFAGLSKQIGASIRIRDGGDHDVTISFCPWLFSLYVSLSARWLGKVVNRILKGDYEGRNISIAVHDSAIWGEIWQKENTWSRDDKWWQRWNWHPLDTFFGRMRHSVLSETVTAASVKFPEGDYPLEITMKQEKWKRPRLPWASVLLTRAHIECEKGVPIPGKGENSWDCDEDATYGLTCPANTVDEAIAAFAKNILRTRRRHGGEGWAPMKKAA